MSSPKPLTVHIVEDHNEVLSHIYRQIGAKRLDFDENTLLHFDSHPDLLIAKGLKADVVFDKRTLFDVISIENWILPAVYAGHFNRIIWLKKEWALQLVDGDYEFFVGKNRETGKLRCSCGDPYFISELLFCPATELENVKSVKLYVCTVIEDSSQTDSLIESLNSIIKNDKLVLDIDLDYFSTQNPFQEMYSTQQLRDFAQLYAFKDQSSPVASSEYRQSQLEFLQQALLKCCKLERTAPSDDDERYCLVQRLVGEQISRCGVADPELLHEHGCTFDTSGLPHHISSNPEIDGYVKELGHILSRLEMKPRIITIARSSDDDYCPKTSVDYIQVTVLSMLQSVYESLSTEKHYEQ